LDKLAYIILKAEKITQGGIVLLKKSFILLVILSALFALAGCSSNGISDGYGELVLNIADKPLNNVEQVLVTIDEVRVNRDDEWETINNFSDDGGEKEFDLMTLRFKEALLGQERLPAGEYNQIRLVVAADENTGDPKEAGKSKVVYNDGSEDNIFIPSGQQSGLKINHDFIVQEGAITELLIDVNVANLLNEAGNSGNIILGPTSIKIFDEVLMGSIQGVVLDGTQDPETAVTNQDVVVEAYLQEEAINEDNIVYSTTASIKEDENGEKAGSFLLRGLIEGNYKIKAYTADNSLEALVENIEVAAGEKTILDTEILLETAE